MNFQVVKITDNIIHLIFPTANIMCRTMCRFAEHFESPEYRNRVFTWRQFRSWYRWQNGDKFTYYNDWSGFNIPSYSFMAFKNGSFDPLSLGEQDVLKALSNLPSTFYVIVTSEEAADAISHELAHALYYLNSEYKSQVVEILDKLPNKDVPMETIRLMGYHPDVLFDELHAYLGDGFEYFNKNISIVQSLGILKSLKYFLATFKLKRLLKTTLKRHISR